MTKPKTSEEVVKDAVEAVRPISAAQGKNLEKLVANDFAQVKQEIILFSQEQVAAKTKEINSQAMLEKQAKHRDAATNLVNEFEKQRTTLIIAAKAQGFELVVPAFGFRDRIPHIKDTSADNAITKATEAILAERSYALEILERERLKAERMVLLATITGTAEDILSGIPTAKSLMESAAANRENKKEIRA